MIKDSDNRSTRLKNSLPRHVAIVMDGNGRWANRRFLPRAMGHREGVKALRRVVDGCCDRGIEVLTVFAFSSENWRRPALEVSLLMELFVSTIRSELRPMNERGVRLRIIGDRRPFSRRLQRVLEEGEAQTRDNRGLNLVIAANYGGRWDIAQAARRLAQEVAAGGLDAATIDADRLSAYLCLADLPEPDLFIRTGGEQRISNFLLWQMAYTEFFFTDRLWPDFDDAALQEAIDDFSR
ncbi:MAG: polyprenyl diphosphate synthase, partial [Candidatus Competibacteraceae bacterium]|nr:polyprenyl diphosphate synthase [Candidatus Competibacteraceae bacterium]